MSMEKPKPARWPLVLGSSPRRVEYMVDAGQAQCAVSWTSCASAANSIANTSAQTAPHVPELRDGTDHRRPQVGNSRSTNAAGAHHFHRRGVEIDLKRRPFIVGRSPCRSRTRHRGLQGPTARSRRGHDGPVTPVISFGFPAGADWPDQTIERIAAPPRHCLIEEVIRRHPEADGKPCVIGKLSGLAGPS